MNDLTLARRPLSRPQRRPHLNGLRRLALGAAAALALAGPAWAADLPAYAVRSGGASTESFAALSSQAADYSLKLVLAAKGTGAYLSDVDITVRSLPSRDVMLEHHSEGPLVLANLPPGRYEVVARYSQVLPGAPKMVKRIVDVPRSGLAQAVLYFDTGDQVSVDTHSGPTNDRF